MVGQCWKFANGYSETNIICIENPQAFSRTNSDGTITQVTWTDTSTVAGRTGNNIVMHFADKSADRTYWGMGVHNAELWFPVHQNSDGSWRSISSAINFRSGCPWCTTNIDGTPHNPTDPWIYTLQVIDNKPGMPLPYLIVPPSVTTGDHFVNETRVCGAGPAGLTFDNVLPPTQPLCGEADGEYWRTDFYISEVATPVYSGPAIVSDQFEGPCGHELWYFAPNWGLVKIESPYDGGEIKHNPACDSWPIGDHVQVSGTWQHDENLSILRTN